MSIRSPSYSKKNVALGEKVVIIGGGLAGCEESLGLVWDHSKDVTIVEMRDTLAPDAPYIHWKHLLAKLDESVKAYCSTSRSCLLRTMASGSPMRAARNCCFRLITFIIATGMRATGPRYMTAGCRLWTTSALSATVSRRARSQRPCARASAQARPCKNRFRASLIRTPSPYVSAARGFRIGVFHVL